MTTQVILPLFLHTVMRRRSWHRSYAIDWRFPELLAELEAQRDEAQWAGGSIVPEIPDPP